jgi:hypothetical protein
MGPALGTPNPLRKFILFHRAEFLERLALKDRIPDLICKKEKMQRPASCVESYSTSDRLMIIGAGTM